MEDFEFDLSGRGEASDSGRPVGHEQNFLRVRSLLSDVRVANDGHRFQQSLHMLREAASLSDGMPALTAEVFETAMEAAKEIASLDRTTASEFLNEASRINPKRVVGDNLVAEMDYRQAAGPVYNSDFESSRQFTQTIEHHSSAIKTADSYVSGAPRLRALLDDLARVSEPEEAERILALSHLELGFDTPDAESAAIFAEIQDQVAHCRSAVEALARDNTPECVEHCNSVLDRNADHLLFLALRAKAKAADYSSQMAAVARIRSLLDCGPLAEAQAAFKKASSQFPNSSELWELDFDLREKAIRVRNLVEAGENRLYARDFDGASESFFQAFQLLPFDKELSGGITGLLHSYARKAAGDDWQASASALALVERIQPGTPVPEDLEVAIQLAREGGARATATLPSDDPALVPEVMASQSGTPEAFESEASTEDATVIDIGKRPRGRSMRSVLAWFALAASLFVLFRVAQVFFVPAPATTLEIPDLTEGTLTIRSNVADALVLINNRKYNLPSGVLTAAVALAPEVYEIRAVREGYSDFGPVTAAIKAGVTTEVNLQMEPKPVSLEIRQANPGLEVMLDGHMLGAVAADGSLTGDVAPGEHYIGLFRDGFIAKTLPRTFVAGKAVKLSDSDVTLESSDASAVSDRRSQADRRATGGSAALKDFVSTLPSTLRASVPLLENQRLEWQKADKQDAAAVQAFAAKYPDGPFASQAKEQLQALTLNKNIQAEIEDWNALDHNNKAALTAFLARHPNGAHVELANGMLANMDRRAGASDPKLEEVASAATHLDTRRPAEGDSLKKADTAAVLAVIQRFADAWSSKDFKSIAAIQRDLDPHTLKTQLGPVKTLYMKISAVMPPQIDGMQATVMCRRQANETFSDGSTRQNPESIVTYVLSKRDGVWCIEHAR